MSRPVVQLHTLDQWCAIDQATQSLILQHIRLKDRLWAFLMKREQKHASANHQSESHWVPCRDCDQRGWILTRPRKPGIHPSQLSGTCMLKVYKEYMGEQQEVIHDAKQMLIFDIGSYAHKMLQDYGRDGAWGPEYQPEVDIGSYPNAKAMNIEGHCDADNILTIDTIPDHPIYEVGVVHEYKTINDNGFTSLKNRPKPEHQQQATVYSACLNRPVTAFLYFNKNNSMIQDFPMAFRYDTWENVKGKIQIVLDAVSSGTPPKGDVGYNCKNCGYYYTCEYRKMTEGK